VGLRQDGGRAGGLQVRKGEQVSRRASTSERRASGWRATGEHASERGMSGAQAERRLHRLLERQCGRRDLTGLSCRWSREMSSSMPSPACFAGVLRAAVRLAPLAARRLVARWLGDVPIMEVPKSLLLVALF
jgi:hypothetical protein